ncbi:hypothetical protein MYCTH_47841 [Thermothelomyces thermophilus ATCC 42464]|uniref:F-box domain-containing protein n=1 Tax=Thermothelomyces thermophilus (strain ATCC 42464 / BCRC 31852 / DSM 1799) TaxID=573729 RepID=G2Q9H4_THET4|nr:uncharacterized protein MYCTH_47841 [Thermothelomyces thermophilus ATCC 42464]AEO56433.1 hypothetical protein MYCTH_47841 [Thermothelomyces thermophilus ATCC 42464]
MSAPHGNGASGGDLEAARRRLARAQAARANATREEIEARGIRPNVQEIVSHMNRTPSHSFKRTRLDHSAAYKIYETEDDEDEGEEEEKEEEEDEEGEEEERRGGEKNGGRHLHEEEEDEDEFESQWQKMLADQGVRDANMFALAEFRQIARQRLRAMKRATAEWRSLCSRPEAPPAPAPPKKGRFNLLGSLCSVTELIVEVCKHVRPVDIVNLYSVSKDFHRAVNQHMRSSVLAWACHMAPTAARVYSSPVYYRWFVPDPAHRLTTAADRELGRTGPGQARIEGQPPLNDKEGEVRLVPGLLWLQMVVNREIRVRDIIACLARRGHRLPEGAHLTLKKIWLVMDAATSQARMMLLNNPDFFGDEDLYIAQLFMVKLLLAFNDPVFGPQSSMLMRLMLGQRGLSPLWALLRGHKYRTPAEIRRLKLRYDVGPEQIQDENLPALHGVEIDQLGVVHFEGWGTGPDHLLRPDELIPLECARRQLDLDGCVEEMMIYGHVDFETGNSLVPALDEMYMSDDDLPPACQGWKPLKHELIHSGCGNDGDRYWRRIPSSHGPGEGGGGGGEGDDEYGRHQGAGHQGAGHQGAGHQGAGHQGADAGGTGGALSVGWDDFLLRNSGDAGYYHHEDGDDDDTEMGDDGDNNNDDDDADVETEGEDINILMGGLHVWQGQEDYQHLVAQQMAEAQDSDEIDMTRYTADEDIGEDERTRRLRDWFRPW